jgi:hypothetical protein
LFQTCGKLPFHVLMNCRRVFPNQVSHNFSSSFSEVSGALKNASSAGR